jgi:hypothetical protein
MAVLDGITPAWGQYNPASLGWDSNDIVPYSYKGTPFPAGVQQITVPLWDALLDQIVPLIPGGLQNPGCWGYNPDSRTVGGTPSYHTVGCALDVNAPSNPFLPGGGSAPHTIPDQAAEIALSLGMEWGGDWTVPVDYMHFEIHLTPAQVQTVAQRLREARVIARGLDYSARRIPGTAIRDAGFGFVMRYLWFPGQQHAYLTREEAADLLASGIAIGPIFESGGNRALAGRAAGRADGQLVLEQLAVVGAPTDQCVYFTVDFDTTQAQYGAIREYFIGAQEAIGPGRVCGYGEYEVLKHLLDDGLIVYGWQTNAWSGGQTDPRIAIWQDAIPANNVRVAGVACDPNTLYGPAGLWGGQQISTGGGLVANISDADAAGLVRDSRDTNLSLVPAWEETGLNAGQILAELYKRPAAGVDQAALDAAVAKAVATATKGLVADVIKGVADQLAARLKD